MPLLLCHSAVLTGTSACPRPPVFRDEFIRALSTNPNPSEDFEASLRILEGLANELDFRKYEAQLFELLIVGRLLAPGGSVLQDASEPCPLAVCSSKNGDKQVKEIVGVFGKLTRRYKYLQKPLEENAMPNILVSLSLGSTAVITAIRLVHRLVTLLLTAGCDWSLIATSVLLPSAATTLRLLFICHSRHVFTSQSIANRLDKPAAAGSLAVPAGDGTSTPGTASGTSTPVSGAGNSLAVPSHPRPNLERLATFTALMVASGQLPVTVLSVMKREHLVKDGTALAFLLTYLKAYSTSGESFDNLTVSLRKGGNSDLLEFFPLPKRAVAELQKEFKAKGLDKVAEWYNKVVEANKKEEIMLRLRDLTAEEEEGEGRASDEEVSPEVFSSGECISVDIRIFADHQLHQVGEQIELNSRCRPDRACLERLNGESRLAH